MKKLAKLIRIITVPPILVFSLLTILWFCHNSVYNTFAEYVLAVIFLMIIPLFAYPLSSLIPGLHKKGRDGQRTLAFCTSFIGYLAGVLYGLAFHVTHGLMLIFWTYFISVLILILFNKVMKLRASGHACSITGPLVLLSYFLGGIYILPCMLLFLLIIWSSLVLKRHTAKDLITGSLTAALAFCISLFL